MTLTFRLDADESWAAARKFLTQCGYTCEADKFGVFDDKVESVSMKVTLCGRCKTHQEVQDFLKRIERVKPIN